MRLLGILPNLVLGAALGLFGAGCGAVSAEAGKPQPEPQLDDRHDEQPVKAEGLMLAKSGQRLSAMGLNAAGAIKFRDFFDEKLKTSCEFKLDASGTPRCFPLEAHDESNLIAFADEACQELAVWYRGLTVGDWITGSAPHADDCGYDLENNGEVFEVGELLREPPAEYGTGYGAYVLRNGVCTKQGPPAKDLPPLHRLVRHEVSEFVSARLVDEQGTADLKVRTLVSEDGARLNLRATLTNGERCTLMGDGSCVPGSIAWRSDMVWLDDSCSKPAMQAFCPEQARYGVVEGEMLDERVVELVKVEQAFSRVSQSVSVDGTYPRVCSAVGPSESTLTSGRDVTGQFPKAEHVAEGVGALRADVVRIGSYTFPIADDYALSFRQAEGGECSLFTAADGTLRCIDWEKVARQSELRSDSACKQKLYVRDDAAKTPLNAELLAQTFVAETGSVLESLSAVHVYQGTVYRNLESCLPVSPDDPYLEQVFGGNPTALLAPDHSVPFDTFPLAEVVRLQ